MNVRTVVNLTVHYLNIYKMDFQQTRMNPDDFGEPLTFPLVPPAAFFVKYRMGSNKFGSDINFPLRMN